MRLYFTVAKHDSETVIPGVYLAEEEARRIAVLYERDGFSTEIYAVNADKVGKGAIRND